MHYVTREAFIRGPVLHRLLGPNYERNLEIGQIRVDAFPPSIQLFNTQLLDARPGKLEPVVVADIGKLVIDFRLLPPNTLQIDRVEARGVDARIVRNRMGVVNLLRVIEDMQEGQKPAPINYEMLAGNETSSRAVYLDRWSVGNWRIAFEDRYRRETPIRAELDIAEVRVLRGNPDEPLNLANGLPLGIEGYLVHPDAAGDDGESVRPLGGEVTLTNPLYPARLGASLQLGLTPTLTELRDDGAIARALPRRDQSVPEWTEAIRVAPVILSVEGSYAGGARDPDDLSNLRVTLRDAVTGATVFDVSDGQYNLRNDAMKGTLRLTGTPLEVAGAIRRLPLPKNPLADSILRRLSLSENDLTTSPTHLDLRVGWTFAPEGGKPGRLSMRGRVDAFTFHDLEGDLSLDVSLQGTGIAGAPPRESAGGGAGEPRRPPAQTRYNCAVKAMLDLSWPELNLRVRDADWRLAIAGPPDAGAAAPGLGDGPDSTAAASNEIPILMGRLEGHSFTVPLPELLVPGYSDTPSTAAATISSRGVLISPSARLDGGSTPWELLATPVSAAFPGDDYDRAVWTARFWYDGIMDRLRLLNLPEVTVHLECPPVPLSRIPWTALSGGTAEPISGLCSWRASLQLFPKSGADAEFQAEAQVSGLRKNGGDPVGLSVRVDAVADEGAIEVSQITAMLTRHPDIVYEFKLMNSRIDLESGEGGLHFEAVNLDHGFIDELMRFGGAEARTWIRDHEHMLEVVEYAHSDVASSASVSLRLDAHLAERILINTQLSMEGMSLRRFRAGLDQDGRFDFHIRGNAIVDRVAGELELGELVARLTDQGEISPRIDLRRTTTDPVVFRTSDAFGLLGTVSGILDDCVAELDRTSTHSLAFAPSILQKLDWIRSKTRNSEPLELEVRWTGFRWTRLQGILEQLGVPFLQGAADVVARLRLRPPTGTEHAVDQPGSADHEPPSDGDATADWSLAATFRGLKLEPGDAGIGATMDSEGELTRDEIRLAAFRLNLAQSQVEMRGRYNLVEGRASLAAGVANLGPEGLRTLERMKNHRLGDILRLERQLPTSLLMLAGGGTSPQFELKWRAEQDRWGNRLRLVFEKDTRNLGPASGFFGGTTLRTEQHLEFDGQDRVALRDFQAILLDSDPTASPVLTLSLASPVELSRSGPSAEWRDANTGEVAIVGLDVEGSLPALYRHGRGVVDRILDRKIQSGRMAARLDSPLIPPGVEEIRSTFAGTATGIRPWGGDREFGFALRGRLTASREAAAFRDIRFDPLTGAGDGGEIRLNAERDFRSGDHSIDCRATGLGPVLLDWLAGPWRAVLAADGTRADLDLHFATRSQGRYEDWTTTLTATNAALSLRGLQSGSSSPQPLHPPLSVDFSTSYSADALTSLVLIRNLHLRAAPMDRSTTFSLIDAALLRPVVFDPDMLTLLEIDASDTRPILHIESGPLPLQPYGKALSYWIGTPYARGTAYLDATLASHPNQPGGPETVLNGAIRVDGLDLRRSPPDSAPAPVAASTTPTGDDGIPVDAAIQFTLRSRVGAVAVERFSVRSPNPDPLPDDQIGLDGIVYTHRKGLTPDVRLQGEFLNLTKYWHLLRESLGEREALPSTALPDSQAEAEPTLRSGFPPSRLRLDLKKIQFRSSTVGDLTALARLDRHRMEVSEASAGMGGGHLNIAGSVDFAATRGVSYRSRWNFENVSLASIFELLAPSMAGKLHARISGTGELNGRGITPPSLNRSLRGQYSLLLTEGGIEGTPGRWLLGDMDDLAGRLDARVAGGNVDFSVNPLENDARKTVRLRGYINDLFGQRRVSAMGRLELRTAVGPPPPRSAGRVEPYPQDLIGVLCRITGSIDSPQALDISVDSYQY